MVGSHSLPSVCEQAAHLVVGHLLEIIVEGCSRLCEAAGRLRRLREPTTASSPLAMSASRGCPFTFQTPPLAQRSDAPFATTVEVTGFGEVGP